ncbi:MAG: VapC toxin family PIN domain ribonuclease, partial [bacterium]|nr:VapC toxin family PIN domain ribonuclease [bacterium]
LGTGPHQRFLHLVTAGQLEPTELTAQDWNRCEELCATYADLGLDLVEPSLIAIAERVGETQIATLNYRDFTVVRPAHTEAFELLPGTT